MARDTNRRSHRAGWSTLKKVLSFVTIFVASACAIGGVVRAVSAWWPDTDEQAFHSAAYDHERGCTTFYRLTDRVRDPSEIPIGTCVQITRDGATYYGRVLNVASYSDAVWKDRTGYHPWQHGDLGATDIFSYPEDQDGLRFREGQSLLAIQLRGDEVEARLVAEKRASLPFAAARYDHQTGECPGFYRLDERIRPARFPLIPQWTCLELGFGGEKHRGILLDYLSLKGNEKALSYLTKPYSVDHTFTSIFNLRDGPGGRTYGRDHRYLAIILPYGSTGIYQFTKIRSVETKEVAPVVNDQHTSSVHARAKTVAMVDLGSDVGMKPVREMFGQDRFTCFFTKDHGVTFCSDPQCAGPSEKLDICGAYIPVLGREGGMIKALLPGKGGSYRVVYVDATAVESKWWETHLGRELRHYDVSNGARALCNNLPKQTYMDLSQAAALDMPCRYVQTFGTEMFLAPSFVFKPMATLNRGLFRMVYLSGDGKWAGLLADDPEADGRHRIFYVQSGSLTGDERQTDWFKQYGQKLTVPQVCQ